VFLLLAALLIGITVLNPNFAEPGQFIRFIQRVAPIAIVAIGQYFVIVSGEFDLSMGSLITAQVVIAGNLIGQDASKSVPVLIFMVVFGALVGLVNGLATTLLKVPSFIVTLGMMLALLGGVLFWTGGAATGNPADEFRQIGRGGIQDVPVVGVIPWSVVILAVVLAVAIWISKRPYGRTLIAVGDNVVTARYAGVRVWWVKTSAFIISSLTATVAGVLLVGYAGVHPSVGSRVRVHRHHRRGARRRGAGRRARLGRRRHGRRLRPRRPSSRCSTSPGCRRRCAMPSRGLLIILAVAYSATTFRARRKERSVLASPAMGKEPELAPEPARPAPQPTPQGD
jgi:ribose transport system permease protein